MSKRSNNNNNNIIATSSPSKRSKTSTVEYASAELLNAVFELNGVCGFLIEHFNLKPWAQSCWKTIHSLAMVFPGFRRYLNNIHMFCSFNSILFLIARKQHQRLEHQVNWSLFARDGIADVVPSLETMYMFKEQAFDLTIEDDTAGTYPFINSLGEAVLLSGCAKTVQVVFENHPAIFSTAKCDFVRARVFLMRHNSLSVRTWILSKIFKLESLEATAHEWANAVKICDESYSAGILEHRTTPQLPPYFYKASFTFFARWDMKKFIETTKLMKPVIMHEVVRYVVKQNWTRGYMLLVQHHNEMFMDCILKPRKLLTDWNESEYMIRPRQYWLRKYNNARTAEVSNLEYPIHTFLVKHCN